MDKNKSKIVSSIKLPFPEFCLIETNARSDKRQASDGPLLTNDCSTFPCDLIHVLRCLTVSKREYASTGTSCDVCRCASVDRAESGGTPSRLYEKTTALQPTSDWYQMSRKYVQTVIASRNFNFRTLLAMVVSLSIGIFQ